MTEPLIKYNNLIYNKLQPSAQLNNESTVKRLWLIILQILFGKFLLWVQSEFVPTILKDRTPI